MDKLATFWENFTKGVSQVIDENNVGVLFTAVARWVFLILALYIVIRTIRSLFLSRSPSEVWSYVQIDGKRSIPITHWENVVGRLKSSDIQIIDNAVSRNHGTINRDSKGNWTYTDLKSKNGSLINGEPVEGTEILYPGDKITVGNAELTLLPISIEERKNNKELRQQDTRLLSPYPSFVALTIFQLLAFLQLWIAKGSEFNLGSGIAMFGITVIMWVYVASVSGLQKRGFEMEILAFFLCTLSLAATTSRNPDQTIKQFIAVIIGIILMIVACSILRNLEFMKRIRKGLVIAAILIADFRIFKDVDYCLLLTFIGFFIFVGNMARIPAVHDFIGNIVSGREVATSIISSQVISNVPAALLLSGFTDNLKGLIVGTNLGGLGTLIASMASLISFKLFAAEKGTSKGKYMLIFTVSNLVFLALLIGLYLLIA